jgi:hypothetical protein
MKRHSAKHQAFLIRKAARSLAHRARRAGLIAIYRRGLRGRFDRRPRDIVVMMAPRHLDFEAHFDQTIDFLNRVRQVTLLQGKRLFIIMRHCVAIAPEAILVLAAEIQRCRHFVQDSINGNNPDDDDVRELLMDIGFHKLLDFYEPPRVGAQRVDYQFIRMKSGTYDESGTWHIEKLEELVLGEAARATALFSRDLSRGLQEAMNNIQAHAYPVDIAPRLKPMPSMRWWIAGYRNATAREIVFMAYDQGVGIPCTLPRTFAETARAALAAVGRALGDNGATIDHHLLMAAMRIGRTSTGQAQHGKGLNDFRRLIDSSAEGAGSLRVLSGHGAYLYTSRDGEHSDPLSRLFDGTLIVWRLADSPLVHWSDGNDNADPRG